MYMQNENKKANLKKALSYMTMLSMASAKTLSLPLKIVQNQGKVNSTVVNAHAGKRNYVLPDNIYQAFSLISFELGGESVSSIVDTGSSILWVGNSTSTATGMEYLCDNSACVDVTTMSPVATDQDYSYPITYAQGITVNPEFYEDTLAIAGVDVTDFNFGVVDAYPDFNRSVFGMRNMQGYSAKSNLIGTLKSQDFISSESFSMTYDGPITLKGGTDPILAEGEIVFGGYNSDKSTSKMETFTIDDNTQFTALKSVSLKSSSSAKSSLATVSVSGDTVLDSGTTTALIIPGLSSIIDLIDTTDGIWKCANYEDYVVHMDFGTDILEVPLNNMAGQYGEDCYMFFSDADIGVNIIGQFVMTNIISYWDYDTSVVGIEPLDAYAAWVGSTTATTTSSKTTSTTTTSKATSTSTTSKTTSTSTTSKSTSTTTTSKATTSSKSTSTTTTSKAITSSKSSSTTTTSTPTTSSTTSTSSSTSTPTTSSTTLTSSSTSTPTTSSTTSNSSTTSTTATPSTSSVSTTATPSALAPLYSNSSSTAPTTSSVLTSIVPSTSSVLTSIVPSTSSVLTSIVPSTSSVLTSIAPSTSSVLTITSSSSSSSSSSTTTKATTTTAATTSAVASNDTPIGSIGFLPNSIVDGLAKFGFIIDAKAFDTIVVIAKAAEGFVIDLENIFAGTSDNRVTPSDNFSNEQEAYMIYNNFEGDNFQFNLNEQAQKSGVTSASQQFDVYVPVNNLKRDTAYMKISIVATTGSTGGSIISTSVVTALETPLAANTTTTSSSSSNSTSTAKTTTTSSSSSNSTSTASVDSSSTVELAASSTSTGKQLTAGLQIVASTATAGLGAVSVSTDYQSSNITTVVTITSCSANKCSKIVSTALESIATTTVEGVETQYTTYCPLSTTAVQAVQSTSSALQVSTIETSQAGNSTVSVTSMYEGGAVQNVGSLAVVGLIGLLFV